MTAQPTSPVEPFSRSPWAARSTWAPVWFLTGLTLCGLGIGAFALLFWGSSTPTSTLLPSVLMTPVR